MDSNAFRIFEWLKNVQPASPGADMVPVDQYNSTDYVSASLRPDANFTLPPPEPKLFLASSELKQDECKDSGNQACMKPFPTDDDRIYRYAPKGPFECVPSQLDMARLRELGLIAAEDFGRASTRKFADRINPDDSITQHEGPYLPASKLVRQDALHFGSALDKQEQELSATSNIPKFYLDTSRKYGNEQSLPRRYGYKENFEYKHTAALFLKETRKVSLLTGNDNEIEKFHMSNVANNAKVEDFIVHNKAYWHLIGLSPELTRTISFESRANEDIQAKNLPPEGVGSAEPPTGAFEFQKPCLSRACRALPSGELLIGSPFELTPSEASVETAESLWTGDGEAAEMRESEAGERPRIHEAFLCPSPQAAQVEGTFGRDGDIQIPIFPYRHSSTRCRALGCPIKRKHEKGPYLHEGKLRARDGNIFGTSNPPPKIWKAYDRIKDQDGSFGGKAKDRLTARDVKIVTSFTKYHFGEAKEWGVRGSEVAYRTDDEDVP